MEIQNVKGTHDIIGEEAEQYSSLESLLSNICLLFGYKEVVTPVIEHSNLFVRGVGESSDVVRKEMYTFDDKAGRSITLRPEFTAGIIRMLVQNKLYATNELPLKLFYHGPVFRYERPQLGRYRQFNQFGVESVGSDNYLNDVECIVLAYTILKSLGLDNVTLKINTLGDDETRNSYREALKSFFAKHIDNMCEDCKSRFELNPLRILDCKDEEDQKIIKNAPKISDYLSKESKERFDKTIKALEEYEIQYEIDDSLVRGLDYYSDVVFEFHYMSKAGNNYGAVGAGGHYDKLVSEVGGPSLPGVGFSFGEERLISVLKDDNLIDIFPIEDLDVYVMPMGVESQTYALDLANTLRLNGFKVDMCFDDVKLANMFKRAERKKAKLGLIIGENEIQNEEIVIKNLINKEQTVTKLENLVNEVSSLLHTEEECDCGCGGECHCGHHHEGD